MGQKHKSTFTNQDILEMLNKPPNYKQPDGNLVRFENDLAIIQAQDNHEIMTVVSRRTKRKDWEEV